jgi:hypothetical protein
MKGFTKPAAVAGCTEESATVSSYGYQAVPSMPFFAEA